MTVIVMSLLQVAVWGLDGFNAGILGQGQLVCENEPETENKLIIDKESIPTKKIKRGRQS